MSRTKHVYPCGQPRTPPPGASTARKSAVKRYPEMSPERREVLTASLENYKRMYGVYPR